MKENIFEPSFCVKEDPEMRKHIEIPKPMTPEEIAKRINDAPADTPPNAACAFCELDYPESHECWQCWLDWLYFEVKK